MAQRRRKLHWAGEKLAVRKADHHENVQALKNDNKYKNKRIPTRVLAVLRYNTDDLYLDIRRSIKWLYLQAKVWK